MAIDGKTVEITDTLIGYLNLSRVCITLYAFDAGTLILKLAL